MVGIWRSLWLRPSETFVANHVAALRRYRPFPIGLYHEDHGLGPRPAFAPFRRQGPARYLDSVARRVGYGPVFAPVLRRSGARLLHAHFGNDGVVALPVARRARLPLVVTFHGFDVTNLPHATGAAAYRAGLQQVFDQAAALLAVSQFIADRLIALGAPADKVAVHHLGIPTRDTPEPTTTPSERSGLTFVGRLVEVKGVADLLTAVSQLPPSLRTTPVRVIGDGPLRADLQAQASRLGVNATFTGRLAPADVAAELARARVFVAPSRTAAGGDAEGFGLVFTEAALVGTPAVGYRSGGVAEAVADGVSGLLAPEGDIAGLTQRLADLLTDDGLADRLGATGRRRVLTDFELDVQTGKLEDLYDRVSR